MKAISYFRPETAQAAISAYLSAGPNARYIAGGTTLYDLMKLGIEQPAHLIDIGTISGFDDISVDGDVLRFGAVALMSDVADMPVVRSDYPVLAESLLKAASQQLRNMATVGGNLLQRTRCPYFRAGNGVYPCNKRLPGSGCAAIGGLDRGQAILGVSDACTAVSAGDWPVALIALDAQVELIGPNGQRTLPVAGFHRLPGSTPEHEFALQSGEMISAIIVPKSAIGRASTYHKIRDRESFAFSLASAAVALEADGTRIRGVRIALGGVATVPWIAHAAEALLTGQELTTERALEAGYAAFQDARPGQHNSFKADLGARVIADALMIALDRSQS